MASIVKRGTSYQVKWREPGGSWKSRTFPKWVQANRHKSKVESETKTEGKTKTETETITERQTTVVPGSAAANSSRESSVSIADAVKAPSSSGEASAPKAVPLTAAQKEAIASENRRRETGVFGPDMPLGCSDTGIPTPARTAGWACEEPEASEPAVAPASAPAGPQTRTETRTRQVTTTRREPPRVRVSSAQVRKKAVDKIKPTAPDLGASPCLASSNGCTGTVGVPVWLWAEDGGDLPSDTATASAGPYTVRATGKVKSVKWSLGDGQETVCKGAGTVFDPDTHGWSAPDCGFETGWKKAGKYTLTATYVWEVSWSGDVNGSTTRELSASEDINVREIQSVVDGHES